VSGDALGGESRVSGGVLIGGQSDEIHGTNWTNYHQPFVLVDSARDLYCCLVDHDNAHECVAAGLGVHRWYHLVISIEGGTDSTENVYLNEVLLRTAL